MNDPSRGDEAGLPRGVVFRTKPQLAAAMVEAAARRGLRARWLTADETYGQDGAFREVVDAMGWWYVAEVPVKQHVWVGQAARRGGARGSSTRARNSHFYGPSVRVDALARRFDERAWQRIQVAEGTLGRRVYEFAFRRVVERCGRRPGREGWLMVRRSLDQEPEIKYFLSNAPSTADPERMAVVGSERWRVESCVKEAKGQTGLDESEGRNWNHWHHHTALSMLAHAFLACARVRWGKTHFPPVGTANEETGRSGTRRTVA
jgi:SRSO17 transposase